MNRAQLEAAAELAADAAACGRLDLLAPLSVLIDALDALDIRCEDLEDGHDAERCTLSGPSQWELTFGHLSQADIACGRLPPDVPGYAR